MSIVYLLKNQHEQYLDKSGEWINGENSRTLFRTIHKDEALNRKVEFSVKSVDLRISIFEASLNAKGDIEISTEDQGAQIPANDKEFALEVSESAPGAENKTAPSETQLEVQPHMMSDNQEQQESLDANSASEAPEVELSQCAPVTENPEEELQSSHHLQAAN